MAKTGASAMKSMRFNQYVIPIRWDCPGESHMAAAQGLATYYPLNLAESAKRQPIPIVDASVSKVDRQAENFANGTCAIGEISGQRLSVAGQKTGTL
jgi:hypothetical protein